jgi:L-alanine-DL-glutamate epimerase-like enolase superfamily enzyme
VVSHTAVEDLSVTAYTIPTSEPESDGTLEWNSTTIVVAEATAGDRVGTGYTYSDVSAAVLIDSVLSEVVTGRDALDIPGAWAGMVGSIRNIGRPGVASHAIAAVDVALWDLKARLLDLPAVEVLGAGRESVPVYGSGGFTSMSLDALHEQLAGWVEQGITRVKMKVGRDPGADEERVRTARKAIGDSAELFVDANGAYTRKQALEMASVFSNYGVTWFEEPVTSDDLEGLRLVRDRAAAGMEIAAGEYGYDAPYFRRMLETGAVDVLQVDATRCAGITGFLQVDALCHSHTIPLSAHTAPSIHAHVACAAQSTRHIEYFHDHVRVEDLLFEGVLQPVGGELVPDVSRPGLGIGLKRSEAVRYQVYGD